MKQEKGQRVANWRRDGAGPTLKMDIVDIVVLDPPKLLEILTWRKGHSEKPVQRWEKHPCKRTGIHMWNDGLGRRIPHLHAVPVESPDDAGEDVFRKVREPSMSDRESGAYSRW